jgi:hypothetical protein
LKGEEGMVFFLKNLEGGGGVGFSFFHFLLLFYYLEAFCYFLFILEGEGGREVFFIFFYP